MKYGFLLSLTFMTSVAFAQSEDLKKEKHAAVLAATSTATVLTGRAAVQNLSKTIKAHDALPRHTTRYEDSSSLWEQFNGNKRGAGFGDEVTINYEIDRGSFVESKSITYTNLKGPKDEGMEIFSKIGKEGGKIRSITGVSYDALKKIKVHTTWAFVDLALTAIGYSASLYELGTYGLSKQIPNKSKSRLNDSDRSIQDKDKDLPGSGGKPGYVKSQGIIQE